MEKTIKVVIDQNASSCSALRLKEKNDNFASFLCGIDVDEHHVFTTYGHMWDYDILSLIERIVKRHQEKNEYEFRNENLDKIEYLYVCDDSQACVTGVDDIDEYYEQLSKVKLKNLDELHSNKRAFHGLKWNEEEGQWEGEIKIYYK